MQVQFKILQAFRVIFINIYLKLIPLRIILRFVDAETACATQSNSNTPARNLRSGKQPNVSNTNTGVFLNRCLFCDKVRKEHNGKKECLTSCSTENIQVTEFINCLYIINNNNNN